MNKVSTTAKIRSGRLGAFKAAEATRVQAERDQEITRHLPLVHSVVERLMNTLPRSVDRDDLFHAGVIGLMDAIDRFDPGRDNAFSTYAVLRIRGAVIDELRARDWVPRGARARNRDYHQAVARLQQSLGRIPDDIELAAELGVTADELPDIERNATLAAQVSLEAPVGDDAKLGNTLSQRDDVAANPARFLERDDQRQVLLSVLESLKEQERLILKLYYFENLLMKEIAAILGVTESRVCQIHSRLMALLRTRLKHAGLE
ncbi:MAG: FliA/WhiG family RNA polymerase sigma factor [Planctomycetota bacterium]|jgi:RNA polymerase sigma factor for flagellar operon FliA|nr:FliA/WhiG family RNA polymerase sigma factor [Planctomycetota bacterium]